MKVVPRELCLSLFVLLSLEDEGRFYLPFIFDKANSCNNCEVKERRSAKNMAHCPECDAEVVLQGLMVGEIIYCPDCNAELEVLSLEQPALALAPQVEEDWGE